MIIRASHISRVVAAPTVTAIRAAVAPTSTFQLQGTNKRYYRGDSSDAYTIPLNDNEMQLYERAKPRSDEILMKHRQLPKLDTIPDLSWDPTMIPNMNHHSASSSTDKQVMKDQLELDIRRKRLIYRAKQRGWLEVDLLLGTYACENVNTMNMKQLNQFEDFINYETIDIYNIMTLRIDIPDHLKTLNNDSVVEHIQQWVKTSPLGKADPEMYKKMKADANLI